MKTILRTLPYIIRNKYYGCTNAGMKIERVVKIEFFNILKGVFEKCFNFVIVVRYSNIFKMFLNPSSFI